MDVHLGHFDCSRTLGEVDGSLVYVQMCQTLSLVNASCFTVYFSVSHTMNDLFSSVSS